MKISLRGTIIFAMILLSFFGLLTILCNNFKLFTGAVGYLASQGKNTPAYLFTLLLIWSGNLVGCFAVGTAVRFRGWRNFPTLPPGHPRCAR